MLFVTRSERIKLLARQYKAKFQRAFTLQEISGCRFPEDSFPIETLAAQVRSIRSDIRSRVSRVMLFAA
jgi:hypothetical protein